MVEGNTKMDVNILKRLLHVLRTAYHEVPYYNNLINDILSQDAAADAGSSGDARGEALEEDFLTIHLFNHLPIFDKHKIIEVGWANFASVRYLDETINPILQCARMEKTSGTSGPPMSILWDHNDYFSSIKHHWAYRYQNYGINTRSRMCTASKRILGDDVCYVNSSGNQMTIRTCKLNRETVSRIVAFLQDYQPEWLYMPNSVLYALLYYAKQLHLQFPKSIRYIEYIGEPLCPYYRKIIEEAIPVPSSNMYGCVETNGIAYECIEGHFHLLAENVYVEIVDREGNCLPDGEVGYVCVTGLHNTAMPMLRYRLNDRARLITNHSCACGNPNPMLELHAARLPEYLLLDDPSIYADAALYYPINSGLELPAAEPGDLLFHMRMTELDHYEVLVFRNPNGEFHVDELLRSLLKAFGFLDIRFTVQEVKEQLPHRPAGLLRRR